MLATSVIRGDSHMEIEEDEEEDDVDFNPVLRAETPSEASSSLSSENEGPCDGSDNNTLSPLDGKDNIPSPNLDGTLMSCDQRSVNENGESIMQFDDDAFRRSKVLNSSIQESCIRTCIEGSIKGASSENRINDSDNLTKKNAVDEVSSGRNNMEPILDDDDAIWRRTRARHSLVNYTLEELETFFQESDDDGDLQNVDDEEEYHKFLAAVLIGGDVQQPYQGDHNCDEDEENDADFEIELEEALESDADEAAAFCSMEQGRKQDRVACVPETRQKKRLKESVKRKKFSMGQTKATLRPILPCMSNSQRPHFSSFGWQLSSPNPFPCSTPYFSGVDLINGFTACQVGQLYCLIHEHVQILLQVFSVCALDPSKQHVARDTQKLISEMVERNEMSLAQMKVSYPQFCFESSNLHSSLQVDSNQMAGGYWTPVVDSPVQSILDVAPLRLAKIYMADVAETVLRHRQSYLETGSVKSHLTKEPLFALPLSSSLSNTSSDQLGGNAATTTVSPSSSCQPQPKKSLAATLVESTMKQSAALVPADISKLAQRFFPLFNPALFPHKPPVPAVANRVLFTDAEDGLLAMGLMEHNNDWLAIQQHFLPCKSKHQIFVRQKNRSSSKAPENPIKTVRRMKNSPLTEDEKILIYEGLKIFKHDWLSIWKFFVPHRDPSLLPRQWRISTGTQKSYKKTEAMKEKRRLSEAKRRRSKALINDLQTSEKEGNDGDNSECDMDCEDEAYVHEAFLADQDAGSSKTMAHDIPLAKIDNNSNPQAISLMQHNGSNDIISHAYVENGTGELQEKICNGNIALSSSKLTENEHSLRQVSHDKYGASYNISLQHLSSCLISRTSRGHLVRQSYRARKTKGLRVVKLAPDLPPVNLPPSVRVISQSAFKIYHSQLHHSSSNHNALKDQALGVPNVAKAGGSVMNSAEAINVLPCSGTGSQHPIGNSHVVALKENTSESSVQLHPLLFQTPSYFSINCQNPPGEGDFLLRSRCSISAVSTSAPDNSPGPADFPTNASTIEFHPLLQRPEAPGDDSAIVSSYNRLSSHLGALQGSSIRLVNIADSECEAQRMGELDLNIQLSSTLGRQSNTEMCENDNVEMNTPILEKRTDEVLRASLKPFNFTEKDLEASSKVNLLVQTSEDHSKDGIDQEILPSSHDISCQQCIGHFNEESNAGIVMEQEELSDSEDENENVIFECEYLEDSEEELCSASPTKIHTKVAGPTYKKSDEIQAAQDLRQLQQSSHSLHVSTGREKGVGGTISSPNALQQNKLARPKPVPGSTKRPKSSRSLLNAFSSSPSRSKKRADDVGVSSPNLGIATVDGRAAGSRRSRRHSALD